MDGTLEHGSCQGEVFRRPLGWSKGGDAGLIESVEFVGDARPHRGRVGIEAVLGSVRQERPDLRQRVRVGGRRDVEPETVGHEDGHAHQVQEAAGTENADHNPPRVAPRNLFDLAVGHDNLFNGDKYKWSARVTVVNLTNKEAL